MRTIFPCAMNGWLSQLTDNFCFNLSSVMSKMV